MTTTVSINGVEYVGLLKKYMGWVAFNEGVTFVGSIKPDKFTDREWALLDTLTKEIEEEERK